MVSALYDPAFHLTSAEYKAKTGQDVNIQDEIERPQVYIIARYIHLKGIPKKMFDRKNKYRT